MRVTGFLCNSVTGGRPSRGILPPFPQWERSKIYAWRIVHLEDCLPGGLENCPPGELSLEGCPSGGLSFGGMPPWRPWRVARLESCPPGGLPSWRVTPLEGCPPGELPPWRGAPLESYPPGGPLHWRIVYWSTVCQPKTLAASLR